MNLLVVGGTRGIGRQLVDQALASGHSVTALARHPERLALEHERLRKVQGDILDAQSLSGALGEPLSAANPFADVLALRLI